MALLDKETTDLLTEMKDCIAQLEDKVALLEEALAPAERTKVVPIEIGQSMYVDADLMGSAKE